jgi:hypothetical protein
MGDAVMFELYRTDTNQRVSVAVYFDEGRAWDAIERTRERIAKGERLDLKDSVGFYSVREQ